MLIVYRLALFQWLVDVSKHGGCSTYIRASYASYSFMVIVVVNATYLTLTDPLGIQQQWSQDRWNQTKSNRDHVRRKKCRESRQTKTDKRREPENDIVARKGHKRDTNNRCTNK